VTADQHRSWLYAIAVGLLCVLWLDSIVGAIILGTAIIGIVHIAALILEDKD
jgi:hypothetical protein